MSNTSREQSLGYNGASAFLVGMASVLNLAGMSLMDAKFENGYDADSNAIRGDFELVGQDIERAISKEIKRKK